MLDLGWMSSPAVVNHNVHYSVREQQNMLSPLFCVHVSVCVWQLAYVCVTTYSYIYWKTTSIISHQLYLTDCASVIVFKPLHVGLLSPVQHVGPAKHTVYSPQMYMHWNRSLCCHDASHWAVLYRGLSVVTRTEHMGSSWKANTMGCYTVASNLGLSWSDCTEVEN